MVLMNHAMILNSPSGNVEYFLHCFQPRGDPALVVGVGRSRVDL